MKVLITGASGFIGRHVITQLNKLGIETIAIGRSPVLSADRFIKADILKEENLPSILSNINATHLIHLAWTARKDYTGYQNYVDSFSNLDWIVGTLKLVKAFRENGGGKIIGLGSGLEYESGHEKCIENLTPISPNTPYGVAKSTIRQLVHMFYGDENFAWARVFMTFGQGEDEDRLIPSLNRVFGKGEPPFPTNGEAYKDYLNVESVANALIFLLLTKAQGEYNICSGQSIQIKKVINLIAKFHKKDPSPMFNMIAKNPNEPQYYCGDNSKLMALGWKPKTIQEEFS